MLPVCQSEKFEIFLRYSSSAIKDFGWKTASLTGDNFQSILEFVDSYFFSLTAWYLLNLQIKVDILNIVNNFEKHFCNDQTQLLESFINILKETQLYCVCKKADFDYIQLQKTNSFNNYVSVTLSSHSQTQLKSLS